MSVQKFGAGHTRKKLDFIDKYLAFYSQALGKQNFRTTYIDAFAGTGEVLLASSDEPVLPGIAPESESIEGSAVRALSTKTPFHQYIFIEKERRKLETLKAALASRFPDRISLCRFICEDANKALISICGQTNWREARAVVFLDPFGNQIEWTTLEILAKTKALDVWYLFPSGLGVYRQIPGNKKPHTKSAESVTKILGSDEWKTLFTKETSTRDLFGVEHITTEKVGDVEAITEHAIARLRTIFEGGVLDQWVRLGGKAVPWYSLLFACSNPSPRAKDLAHKVAKWIVKSS